jgi:hypothetical protein
MPRTTEDKLGNRYGRLVVIGSIHIRGLGTGWKCVCDCGKETYVASANLSSGNTTSCGCAALEARTTHGKSKDRVYVIWKAMRTRCQNPRAHEFRNYGGRGISVCERWQKFENFLEDMGEPPDRYWLERLDNNGNYEPGNCKWDSPKNQLSNRRNNHVLSAFGRTQTITMWSEEFGIPVTTLRNRIVRMGLSLPDALTYQQNKES